MDRMKKARRIHVGSKTFAFRAWSADRECRDTTATTISKSTSMTPSKQTFSHPTHLIRRVADASHVSLGRVPRVERAPKLAQLRTDKSTILNFPGVRNCSRLKN